MAKIVPMEEARDDSDINAFTTELNAMRALFLSFQKNYAAELNSIRKRTRAVEDAQFHESKINDVYLPINPKINDVATFNNEEYLPINRPPSRAHSIKLEYHQNGK